MPQGETCRVTTEADQWCVSRCHQRLHGAEAHPEGRQGTTAVYVYHQGVDALLPLAESLYDEGTVRPIWSIRCLRQCRSALLASSDVARSTLSIAPSRRTECHRAQWRGGSSTTGELPITLISYNYYKLSEPLTLTQTLSHLCHLGLRQDWHVRIDTVSGAQVKRRQ
jgi:hypothetical protein